MMRPSELVFYGYLCILDYDRARKYVSELSTFSRHELGYTASLFHLSPEVFVSCLKKAQKYLASPEGFLKMKKDFCNTKVEMDTSHMKRQILEYGLRIAFDAYPDLLRKEFDGRLCTIRIEFDDVTVPKRVMRSVANLQFRSIHAEVSYAGESIRIELDGKRPLYTEMNPSKEIVQYANSLVHGILTSVRIWPFRSPKRKRDMSSMLKALAILWPHDTNLFFWTYEQADICGDVFLNENDIKWLNILETHPGISVYEDVGGKILYSKYARPAMDKPPIFFAYEKDKRGFKVAGPSSNLIERFLLVCRIGS